MQTTVRNVALVIAMLALLIAIALFIVVIARPPELPISTPQSTNPTSGVTPSSNSSVLLSEDFEDAVSDKYPNEGGKWAVTEDEIGNHVLNANSIGQSWAYYRLGLLNFTDGVMEYRVRLLQFDPTSRSGEAFVIFREADSRYQFVIQLAEKSAVIYFQGTLDPWLPLHGKKTVYSYNFEKGVWYSVRIECRGNIIQAYIDGTLAIDVEDTRASKGSFSLAIAPNTIAQYDDIRISKQSP